jgi:hypothetical protein
MRPARLLERQQQSAGPPRPLWIRAGRLASGASAEGKDVRWSGAEKMAMPAPLRRGVATRPAMLCNNASSASGSTWSARMTVLINESARRSSIVEGW